MTNILVIANRGQYNHRIYRTLKYLKADAKLIRNNISIAEVEKENPKGIVIGGGPYLEETGNSEAILEKFYKTVPILGICLGHQLIARHFGGEIRTAEIGEYAGSTIFVDEEDDLLKGLGQEFEAWVSHKDEVITLPKNFVKLAHSSICDIEAMKHSTLPLFGVQFHPEVEHTPKGPDVFKNFLEICGVS